MGFFAWVGSLIDQLIEWLGRAVKAFIEALVWGLQKLWETVVVGVLIAAFGLVATLYVIFYAGAILGETIMEIWDPRYYNTKPSQVFTLGQAPQNSPLPINRSEAKTLTLENWS
ncbi:hypothetical protein BCD67_23600 [Oscillatoriales cyanobacterium USR001]|nr:hypothetical protein BCD67_23600 [Oscillatoriales cyanobacterium USR001]